VVDVDPSLATYVSAGTCDVSYEVVGSGFPIVLIHGLGAGRVLWQRLRGRFDDNHKILLYDLRGAGATTELETRPLSLETWVDDLRALLAALGIERPTLVGHSLGGAIALKYAITYPADVEALILMGTEADLSNLGPRMLRSAERVEQHGMERWVSDYWVQNPPFSDDSLRRDPALLDDYRAMLLGNDAGDYVRSCRAIASAEDLGERLAEVQQPALVIVGAEDDRTLPEHGRELASRLPHGRVLELAGVGHTLPMEAGDALGAAILQFLADARAPLPEGGRP
jgi:pimeloyl-ACP methyl ester carboxylesterase